MDLQRAIKSELFKNLVEWQEGECWNWQGKSDKNGYGIFSAFGLNGKAHRVSYSVFVEPVPHSLLVCHKCDHPKCINPSHLFLGTSKDNFDDMKRKGRWINNSKSLQPKYGTDNNRSKLTKNQVIEIRNLREQKNLSYDKIANLYDVSKQSIISICKRKTWTHI